MIGFWLGAAALTAVAVLLVLRPLMRPPAEALPAGSFARSIYKDQLAEIDRDRERGVRTPEQAKAARAEVGRRLLAAANEAERAEGRKAIVARPSKKTALALTVLLPVAALAVYLPLGRPELPAEPFAGRDAGPEVPHDVQQAMERLERTLQDNPNDLEGWSLLAATYAATNRHAEAAEAYRKAVSLSQGDTGLMSAFGEALTNASDGIVGQEARRTFEAVLTQDPKDPRARYYLANARLQAGDVKGAIDRWAALLAESPEDAPWVDQLRRQIHEAAISISLDPIALTPKPLPPAGGQPPAQAQAQAAAPGAGGMPALTPEQMEAMSKLSPEERQAAIRSMVDGLAAKLEENPKDADGWLRLARARENLGEPEAAEEALRRATEAAPERADIWLAYARAIAPEGEAVPSLVFLDAMRTVLRLDPQNPQALYYLGQNAANSGKTAEARELWTKLIDQLPAEAPIRAEMQRRLDALK